MLRLILGLHNYNIESELYNYNTELRLHDQGIGKHNIIITFFSRYEPC